VPCLWAACEPHKALTAANALCALTCSDDTSRMMDDRADAKFVPLNQLLSPAAPDEVEAALFSVGKAKS
jgi:hypothetical protein